MQQCHIGRNLQFVGDVPSGLIQHQHDMDLIPGFMADMVQMMIHIRRIHRWGQQRRGLPRNGIDRPEKIDPLVFGLLGGCRAGSFFRPNMCQRSLLSNSHFILEPDLDLLVGVLVLEGTDKKGALSSHCCIFSGLFL